MFLRKKTKTTKSSKLPDGRKYRLAIISLFVILGGYGLAGLNPAFAALYPQLISAILGVNALYFGGNVGNKWVLGKKGDMLLGVGSSSREVTPNGTVSERGDIDTK